jgi:hypothetical protein
MGSIETVNTLVNHTVPLRLSECIHRTTLDSKLSELYSENIVAKVIRTADKHLLNNVCCARVSPNLLLMLIEL